MTGSCIRIFSFKNLQAGKSSRGESAGPNILNVGERAWLSEFNLPMQLSFQVDEGARDFNCSVHISIC